MMATITEALIEQETAEMTPPSQFHSLHALDPQVRKLSRLQPWKGLAAIAFDWVLVSGLIALALQFPHPIVWVIIGFVVATRQHGLLIIMHDASHYRLLRHRGWNDRISNWFLAWPLLVTTEGYRQNHLAHHWHLNSDDDPDWMRKKGKPEWDFPKTKWQVVRILARDFFGGGIFDQLKAIRDLSGQKLTQAKTKPLPGHRLAYYGILAGMITALDLWIPVLLLWFLPAFLVLPVLLRLRSIAEHFGVEGEHELNMSRNIHCGFWERLFLAPHSVGYHLDHHLYPSVPFYNLPKLHAALRTIPDYELHAHQTGSLLGRKGSSVIAEVSPRN